MIRIIFLLLLGMFIGVLLPNIFKRTVVNFLVSLRDFFKRIFKRDKK